MPNVARLTKLKEHLKTVDPKRFDMREILIRNNGERPNLPPIMIREEIHTLLLTEPYCGTAGCVLGHAYSNPEFIADGLRWAFADSYFNLNIKEYCHIFGKWTPGRETGELAIEEAIERIDDVVNGKFSNDEY